MVSARPFHGHRYRMNGCIGCLLHRQRPDQRFCCGVDGNPVFDDDLRLQCAAEETWKNEKEGEKTEKTPVTPDCHGESLSNDENRSVLMLYL
jgi:hypothetical protein